MSSHLTATRAHVIFIFILPSLAFISLLDDAHVHLIRSHLHRSHIERPSQLSHVTNHGDTSRANLLNHHISPETELLATIRARTRLSPRWPRHPRLNVPELRSYGPAYSSIIISDKLRVIYLPVFKVGTTSMMWHIAYLENNPYVLSHVSGSQSVNAGSLDYLLHEMSTPAWQNHTAYRRSDDELRRVFEDPSYLKFGFVRNPFDRVISAYVDKIVRCPINSEEYQKQMHALYGDDVYARTSANMSKPSFNAFLSAVSEVIHAPRTEATDWRKSQAYENNLSRRDLHWRPQVELLHPDLIHVDFVGRFESMQRDREVVLQWMYRHTDRRMPAAGHEKLHATDPHEKVKLYQLLKDDDKARKLVIDTYRKDFDRFQFSRDIPVV